VFSTKRAAVFPPLFFFFAHSTWFGGLLIQDQPIQTKLLDTGGELLEVDRLLNVAIDAEIVSGSDVRIIP
jgi:hypothetical protein